MPEYFSVKQICLEFLLEPVQGLADGMTGWKDFDKNLEGKKILQVIRERKEGTPILSRNKDHKELISDQLALLPHISLKCKRMNL